MAAESLGGSDRPTWATLTPTNASVCRTVSAELRFDSKNRYDPNEGFFPGVEYVDGTVEGAMKAGLEAYPLSDYNNTSTLGRVLSLVFGRKR
jgi:hypothetical protein